MLIQVRPVEWLRNLRWGDTSTRRAHACCLRLPRLVEWRERDRSGTFRRCYLALAWINALIAGEPDSEIEG